MSAMIRNVARVAGGGPKTVVKATATRAFNWDALGRKAEADPEAKADYNSLKVYWDGIEKDFATWSKPVAPINWDHYKKTIETPGFVDFLKTRYESIDWNSISTKLSDAELEADKAEKEAMLKEGAALVAAAEKVVAETKEKLAIAQAKRTTRDSMVEDVWAKNPKIKEEVLQEIEDHAWFKDVK